MTSMNTHTDQAATTARSLLGFTAVALPAGWTFLSVPLFTGWPIERFVLATLFLGVVPVRCLSRSRHDSSTPQLAAAARLRAATWSTWPWTRITTGSGTSSRSALVLLPYRRPPCGAAVVERW